MDPDLYKGLGVKSYLSKYDMLLVRFDGKMEVPKGQIKLSIMIEGKEVMVNFIVVNAFSPYTLILGQPWIHARGVVPSTLYQKVNLPTEDGVFVVRNDQKVAR